jgi:hypothetical protein
VPDEVAKAEGPTGGRLLSKMTLKEIDALGADADKMKLGGKGEDDAALEEKCNA